MRQNLSDIIVNELQAEHDEIVSYRFAVSTGVEDHVHPVLDDNALTDAMQKVIEYYKTKIDHTIPYTQAPDDFYLFNGIKYSFTDIGDTQLNIDFDSDDAYYNPFKDGFDSKYVPGGERD
jgi:hypothetical protein